MGTAYGTLTLRNCVNYSNINTTGGNVGGIIGSTGNATIIGCYNTADISGVSTVGGIFGGSGYAVTIIGCCNTGNISGNNNIGGNLSGPSYGSGTASLRDSYSTGTVTGNNSNVGGALGYYNSFKATVARVYYMEGAFTSDSAATKLTAEQLKNADLSADYFAGTCDGYPALLWQTDVTFHATDSEGTVTAPTCTGKGYTSYVCDACGASYNGDYVDALGHDWCDHEGYDETCTDCVYTAPTCTEAGSILRYCVHEGCDEPYTDVIPATGHTEDESQTVDHGLYKDCVCAVCGESYRVWDDGRLQYMTLDMTVLSNITLEDNTYPWAYNAGTGRVESTNKGVGSSTSQTSVTVTLTDTATVFFNYGVSSEVNYDKLTITAYAGDTAIATIASAISGNQASSFEITLDAGTYTLTFAYSKDSSANGNSDVAWFSDVVIEAPHVHNYETVVVQATCTEGGSITYSCECGDSYVEYTEARGHRIENGACTRCGLTAGWSGDLTWTLDEEGKLTFYGEGKMRAYTYKAEVPWYDYREQVTSVVLNEGVTRISGYAFYGMTNLVSVIIPAGVTEIREYAFKNCTSLTEIVLPAGVTMIGDSAFYGCTALTGVAIPEGVTSVGEYAFKGCGALAAVTLPETLETISDSAFYGIAATEIVIPAKVASVGAYAFARCYSLSQITFEGAAPAIGEGAFNKITATVYTSGWDAAVKQNYGGTITWEEA